MKKRIFAGLTAILTLLALTACGGNPDGKELLKKAVTNKDPITYSTLKIDFSIEDLTGLGMAMRMESQSTEEAMILACDFNMLGSSAEDTLYMNGMTTNNPQIYFEGTDGSWYSIRGSTDNIFNAMNGFGSFNSLLALSLLPSMCSEIETIGKETLNDQSVYKIHLVLDANKLLKSSLTGVDTSNLGQAEFEIAQQIIDMIKIHVYIEEGTSRFAAINFFFDKEAYKTFMEDKDISEELAIIDGMNFSMDATVHYDEKDISLPAGTANATPLTDEEEIMEKMPLMQGLMSILSMANNLNGM